MEFGLAQAGQRSPWTQLTIFLLIVLYPFVIIQFTEMAEGLLSIVVVLFPNRARIKGYVQKKQKNSMENHDRKYLLFRKRGASSVCLRKNLTNRKSEDDKERR
jgi:hypothetical protein